MIVNIAMFLIDRHLIQWVWGLSPSYNWLTLDCFLTHGQNWVSSIWFLILRTRSVNSPIKFALSVLVLASEHRWENISWCRQSEALLSNLPLSHVLPIVTVSLWGYILSNLSPHKLPVGSLALECNWVRDCRLQWGFLLFKYHLNFASSSVFGQDMTRADMLPNWLRG